MRKILITDVEVIEVMKVINFTFAQLLLLSQIFSLVVVFASPK